MAVAACGVVDDAFAFYTITHLSARKHRQVRAEPGLKHRIRQHKIEITACARQLNRVPPGAMCFVSRSQQVRKSGDEHGFNLLP